MFTSHHLWMIEYAISGRTEQRPDQDENLDGGGEVPVGLLSDQALLQPGSVCRRTVAAAAAVPPARCIQEIQPEAGGCEIHRTVPHRSCLAPAIHLDHAEILDDYFWKMLATGTTKACSDRGNYGEKKKS